MDKYFFIEVQVYKSVNKMGQELGQYVEEKYHQKVVHESRMCDIRFDIEDKIKELKLKYPKCKDFELTNTGYTDRYGIKTPYISVKPQNCYNDNYAFIMNTKFVRNKNIEIGVL